MFLSSLAFKYVYISNIPQELPQQTFLTPHSAPSLLTFLFPCFAYVQYASQLTVVEILVTLTMTTKMLSVVLILLDLSLHLILTVTPECLSWFGSHNDAVITWFYSIFSHASGIWAYLRSFIGGYRSSLSFSLSLLFSHFIDPSSAILPTYMISTFFCMLFQNWSSHWCLHTLQPQASLSSWRGTFPTQM